MSVSKSQSTGLLVVLVGYTVVCVALLGYLTHNPVKTSELASIDPPNFSAINEISERKAAFFEFIEPLIIERNESVLRKRAQLQHIADYYNTKGKLNSRFRGQLHSLANTYRIDDKNLDTESLIEELDTRIDQIPASMILAQAANESAWGMSRFAVQGNNYFGQWCYRKGCGLIPQERHSGAAHEVAKFKDARASVRSYFLNINTHNAYKELRSIRKQLRNSQQSVTGLQLIEGLRRYSERGDAYVEELANMIRFNGLAAKDTRINTQHQPITLASTSE